MRKKDDAKKELIPNDYTAARHGGGHSGVSKGCLLPSDVPLPTET